MRKRLVLGALAATLLVVPTTASAHHARTATQRLSVTNIGTGSGVVTSTPAAISCPNACTADFADELTVTLSATPDAGSVFTGWHGDCTGTTGPCVLTMSSAKSVQASFDIGSPCPIAVPATPPNSANTCVTASVVSTVSVTAPAVITFPALPVGGTSAPVAAPVNVKSNGGGYQLSVTRTEFTNGDIPLSIQSGTPTDAGMVLQLSGLAPIPTSDNLNIGRRSGSVTPDAGDAWPLSLVLGPVPAVAAGKHASIVTFTAVAF
jgi:hypothetical protein